MKFVLSNIAEANSLIIDDKFADFRVFISPEEIEVEGVIKFNDLCDIDSIERLKTDAKGIF